MVQTDLWHDTMLDAVGAAVQSAGGVKRVAAILWPAMDATSAAAKLRACLNPDHAQKFDPEELKMIGRLARDAGDMSLPNFLAREWDLEVKPIAAAEAKERALSARKLALLAELARLERGE